MEKKTIGSFIAALRKANGMTQKDLAEKLNVSDKTVSRWERDDGAPDLSVIPVIAEIFGITCDELLRGERKSPEERTEAAPDSFTPKGEKQKQRILRLSLSKYKTRSLIALCISLVGLLVAMAFNFGFNRAYLGFLSGCVFYLVGAACQAIFVNGAFLAVADEEDTGDFKWRVIAIAEGVWLLTAVLLGASLPLMVGVYDAYWGLSGGAWLLRGLVYGGAFGALYAMGCWLVNGRLMKRGVYTPRSNFAYNHRLQRNCALALAAVLAASFGCQWYFNQFIGPDGLAEWQTFEDVESFKAFMAEDVEYHGNYTSTEPVASPSGEYYDENGNVISEEEAYTRELLDGEGNVLITYVHRNETVQNVRYSFRDGETLFLKVLTRDAWHSASILTNTINSLFGILYCVEGLCVLVVYLKKRQKV